jgi:hypothetical protein
MSALNKFKDLNYVAWKRLSLEDHDEFMKFNKPANDNFAKLDKIRHERGQQLMNSTYEEWLKLNRDDRESFWVVNELKNKEYYQRWDEEKKEQDRIAGEEALAKLEKEKARIAAENLPPNPEIKSNQDEDQALESGSGGDIVFGEALPDVPGGVPKDAFKKILRLAETHAQEMIKKYGIPFEKLDKSKLLDLIKAALSCILNGPFNPHNKTTFGDKEYSIESCFIGVKFSNNDWKEFCRPIASYLKMKKGLLPCNMVRRIGNYWPLVEYVSQKQGKK